MPHLATRPGMEVTASSYKLHANVLEGPKAISYRGKNSMPISTIIEDSFSRSFVLYRDLIESIDASILDSRIPEVPSNTVGLQLWCVVGARESFSNAIEADEWREFSCSLQSPTEQTQFADALRHSAEAVSDVLTTIEAYSDVQNRLIIDLLEDEAAYHDQLIRYLYGLKLDIPDSWKSKYSL